MQIYEKPVRQLMWDMVKDLDIQGEDVIVRAAIIEWFAQRYPKLEKSTITAHITRMSTNAPSRVHYNAKPDDNLLYQIDSRRFRLYDPGKDPTPIYKKTSNGKIKSTESYDVEVRLGKTFRDEVFDEELKERLARLGDPPLDTIIREAGVVLEHRLRSVGGIDRNLYGARLVDSVVGENGVLIFSSNPREQEGVKMLYRGAMQFIRNPPMHNLIEYKEITARLYVRLIDTLLQFLTELQPRHRDEISVDSIRLMLTRRPLTNNLSVLLNNLYAVGEEFVSASDLVAMLNINKLQFSGVLGSLGQRVNTTQGLEGKGGINVVLEVEPSSRNEWMYRMRPILRKALELENLV